MRNLAIETRKGWRNLFLTTAGMVVLTAPWLRARSQVTVTPAPSFEVVSIKPNPSGSGRVTFNPGRFTATGSTTKALIEFAYNVKDFQLLGASGWINSDKYDIEATEGDSVGKELQSLTPFERAKRIRLMLQSLLADRFKLKLSHETKELPVYALVVANNGPKFTQTPAIPVVPAGSNPQGSRPRGPSIGMPLGGGQITANGVPIGLLAEILPQQPELAGRVVLDKTGLKGNYDFTLKWTPEVPSSASQATDNTLPDSSLPSIFTALQEQLGLKLESQTAPVDVLVIDHVEQPSEN